MFFDVYELLKSYTNENFSLHWILWWIFFPQGYGERNLRVLPDGFIKPSWAFLTRYQVWVWRCHFKCYFHISFLGFLQGKCLFGPCPTVSHAYHLMCSLLITNTLKTFIFLFFFISILSQGRQCLVLFPILLRHHAATLSFKKVL